MSPRLASLFEVSINGNVQGVVCFVVRWNPGSFCCEDTTHHLHWDVEEVESRDTPCSQWVARIERFKHVEDVRVSFREILVGQHGLV